MGNRHCYSVLLTLVPTSPSSSYVTPLLFPSKKKVCSQIHVPLSHLFSDGSLDSLPLARRGPTRHYPPLHRRSDWDKVHGPLQYRSGPVLYYRRGAQGGEQEQGLLRLGLPGQGLPGISKPTSETPLQEPGARKNNVEEVSGLP